MPRTKKEEIVENEEIMGKTETTEKENITENVGVEEEENKEELETEGSEEDELIANEEAIKEENPVETARLTEKDAEDFKEEMTLEDAFVRRTISLPGKRKKRKVFRDEEKIIGDEDGEIETYGSLKRKEYEMLSDSAKSEKPKVLYGRIDGIEEIELNGARSAYAICHLITDKRADINTDKEVKSGIYKIKIPAPMLFIFDKPEYLTPEGYESLKLAMDMRVGSVVEFIVYDINPDEDEVLASRVAAMRILSYDNYLGRKARIKPGSLAKGYITYVNAYGITVDVFGAEFFIAKQELAWRYIKNVFDEKKYFHVGKPVPVRIQSIEKANVEIYGRNYPYLKVIGSIKDATDNPNRLFYEKYQLGQKYKGQVGYRLMSGEYIVNLGADGDGLNGDRAVVFCKAPAIELGGTPHVGQNCSVAITGKFDDTCRFIGAFTYLEP